MNVHECIMSADEWNLDGSADKDEKEVGGCQARQERVGRGLERSLLHHRQDDQKVAKHTKRKYQPESELAVVNRPRISLAGQYSWPPRYIYGYKLYSINP